MFRIIAATAVLLAPGLALAQDPVNDAGEAAGRAVHDVCLTMFDGQPSDAARLGTLARAQNLSAAGTGWRVPSGGGSTVTIDWMAENNVCQVTVTGPAGSGLDLLPAMAGIGWTAVQSNVQSSPDMAVDVWTGQPQGVSSPLYVVANKWTSSEEPDGGKRLVIVVVRAQ